MCKKIIAVAMSGGVDSSTIAAMLLEKKSNIFGVTMYLHEHSEKAVDEAAKVCRNLGIEHFVFDLRLEFTQNVINLFKRYYENGMTPNPCAFCNRDVKMGALLEKAMEKGAELMATGHYVRNDQNNLIMESLDKTKDQSYFLALVNKESLQKTLFPLGNISSKEETRKTGKRLGMDNFDAAESQDICFIPDHNYKKFLQSVSLIPKPGKIIHIETGRILGNHDGVFGHTTGQRKGLKVSFEYPLYVIKIDATNNIIYVGDKNLLYKDSFEIGQANWLADVPNRFEAYVKIRSTCKKLLAKIEKAAEVTAKITLLEKNETPIATGQVCAIYQGEILLGGGIIKS